MNNRSGPILVLGGTGRLGRSLRAIWPEQSTAFWQSRRPKSGWLQCELDGNPPALETLMRTADIVLCLAGVTGPFAQNRAVPLSDNSRLAQIVLRTAAKAGSKRVLLASSSAVYGRAQGHLDERVEGVDVSPYGASKRQMEQDALHSARELGLEVCCLRLGNIAGVDAALGGWSSGFQLDQFPDGSTPQRSYIGLETLAQVICDLAHAKKLPEILNVATPNPLEMGTLLDAADLPWHPRRAERCAIAKVHLNTGLLSEVSRIQPEQATAPAMVAQWRRARDQMQVS